MLTTLGWLSLAAERASRSVRSRRIARSPSGSSGGTRTSFTARSRLSSSSPGTATPRPCRPGRAVAAAVPTGQQAHTLRRGHRYRCLAERCGAPASDRGASRFQHRGVITPLHSTDVPPPCAHTWTGRHIAVISIPGMRQRPGRGWRLRTSAVLGVRRSLTACWLTLDVRAFVDVRRVARDCNTQDTAGAVSPTCGRRLGALRGGTAFGAGSISRPCT